MNTTILDAIATGTITEEQHAAAERDATRALTDSEGMWFEDWLSTPLARDEIAEVIRTAINTDADDLAAALDELVGGFGVYLADEIDRRVIVALGLDATTAAA